MARRYVRDNRGRFASKGAGATARGGRLKTAGGNKRATQTMKASGAKPAGAIKGKVKRDPAAASRVGQSGAAPATTTKLKRSGTKTRVGATETNMERGRRGVASMSPTAKASRRSDVAERRSERLERITERQSGIVARRQINRASNYNPDGTFNQSAANANQRRLKRSQQLQERLRTAATGPAIASGALARKKPAKPAAAAAKPRAGKAGGKTKPAAAAKPSATTRLKRSGATMKANAFPRNAIAKSALKPTGNPYGYGDTRQGNIRAAVRQAREAGVPIKIDRRRNPRAMATYSDADQAITIYARSSGWANRSATAIARRRSNFSSSSRPEGLMAHEIAHARSKTLTSGANWRSVAQQAQVRLGEGWDQMRPIRQIANRVSAYARENPQEFIAEFRAARAAGRRFDPEVVRLYRAAAAAKPRSRRRAR